MDNQLTLPEYTKDDFLDSERPFEYVMSIQDRVKRRQTAIRMAEYAKSLKVTGFMKLLEDYMRSLPTRTDAYADNICSFQGQQMELKCGDWECSENGILRHTSFGDDFACVHPIMPIERYVNVDTGVEKLKIWWRKGKSYRTGIFDRRVLATASGIVQLADHGVAVNSESAKTLVRWLHDAENLNYELIPEKQSVGRLGWIESKDDNPDKFSPYCANLEFDGDDNFKTFFEAVRPTGKYAQWFSTAKTIREKCTVTARVVLAASFASALVKPFNCLPFFVHLWGGTETHKTVALMLAASVWANPEMGRYIHTFNSTSVGKEMSAYFVNSLPLILDELQLAKSKNGQDEDIYKLAEGVGKTRSNKTLGLNKSPTWKNCIITSGEQPITTARSGGGAVNRILEIECKDKIFGNHPQAGAVIADTTRKNYGHAGKKFIERLLVRSPEEIEQIGQRFKAIYFDLCKTDTTEKQAMAAALVLVADELITEWIFKDGRALQIDEIHEFLASKASTNANERGYHFMCEWVAQNAARLKGDGDKDEVWGALDISVPGQPDTAYIVRSRFFQAAEDAGYSAPAMLSWMKQKGLIQTRGRALTVCKRINRVQTECVALLLPEPDEIEDFEPVNEEMPF